MLEMPIFNLPRWFIIIAAVILPGSGYVLTGRPYRALTLLCFLGFFTFITYNLTGENISPIGRFSGGIAIWCLSVVDIVGKKRLRGYELSSK